MALEQRCEQRLREKGGEPCRLVKGQGCRQRQQEAQCFIDTPHMFKEQQGAWVLEQSKGENVKSGAELERRWKASRVGP